MDTKVNTEVLHTVDYTTDAAVTGKVMFNLEDKAFSVVDAKVNTEAIHIVDVSTDAEATGKAMLDLEDKATSDMDAKVNTLKQHILWMLLIPKSKKKLC